MRTLSAKTGTSLQEIVAALAVDSIDAETAVNETVSDILREVRVRGDDALLDYTERFDGAKPESLFATAEDLASAEAELKAEKPELMQAITTAISRVRTYHEKQMQQGFLLQDPIGATMGQIVRPLARVGIYIPGGTAAYPSTVYMNVIPALVAGVKEIVVATPVNREGKANRTVLAVCSLLGVKHVLLSGGAQAVAALAYGTQSVPRVDKITGPGNRYVATAKRMVYGTVDIDMIAGPSEILVVADETANPEFVAADLLSQAEHDPNARVIVVTTDEELAARLPDVVEEQLKTLSRAEICRQSVDNNGVIIITDTMAEAIALSNELAPEHLSLQTKSPMDVLPHIHNAGSIFLGDYTPEALGDYAAGPNHTLPTSGTARFSSPLSVTDFMKKSSFTYFQKEAFAELAQTVLRIAREEGLEAHARAVEFRLEVLNE